MNYKYNINELKIFGYHGVYDDEKENGQFFLINVDFEVIYNNDINDNIINAIDYSAICDDIVFVFNKRCDLIETVIDNITSFLENKYENIKFYVSISKEQLSMKHELKNISVANIK